MVNGLFKNASSNFQLSSSEKCVLVACAFMCAILFALICLIIPVLAFVAGAYVGWELSWKFIVALIVSRNSEC